VAHPDAGLVAVALAPEPGGGAVDALARDGRLMRVEAVSLARSLIGKLGARTTQLLAGYHGVVWVAETNGRVLGVQTSSGRVLHVMHVARHSRLAIVGGWLAAMHGHSLRMLALGSKGRGTLLSLPGAAGAFSFAVL
jgi:hypothetical protein